MKLRGELRWRSRVAGEWSEWRRGPNMVVDAGVTRLIDLLLGASADAVTEIVVGSSSAEVSAGDTAIADALATTAGDSDRGVDEAGQMYVELSWGLNETQGNGLDIQECGIRCADGTLFARRLLPHGVKTNEQSLEGTWRITFER